MKIIFLDFDGVVRVRLEPGMEPDFSLARMRLIQWICEHTDAKVVVSSDWRSLDNKDSIVRNLSPCLGQHLHEDWGTPICGFRWKEVQKWLEAHPEVKQYAILEDWPQHFEGCPDDMFDRLVLCEHVKGLQNYHTSKILNLLGPKDSP